VGTGRCSGTAGIAGRGVIAVPVLAGAARAARAAGRRGQPPGALAPTADPLAHLAGGPAGQGDGRGDPDRGRLFDHWERDGVVGEWDRGGRLRWLGDQGGRWQDPQVDRLAGLDDPGLAGLGLADGLGVDAGSFPHAGLGEPSGTVEVQLPVVLQGADHPS